jgi:hypothetical protein
MSQPLLAERLGPGIILSIRDLETLFGSLPAEARANALWSRAPIEAGVRRLIEEPWSDALLVEVADELARPLLALARPFAQVLARDGSQREQARIRFREDAQVIGQYIPAEARETFAWCTGVVESLSVLIGFIDPDAWQLLTDDSVERAMSTTDLQVLTQAQAALLALSEVVRTRGSRERAAQLVDAAFLSFCAVQDCLAREGLTLEPFRDESPRAKAERSLRYASLARDALRPEDSATLDEARLRPLRGRWSWRCSVGRDSAPRERTAVYVQLSSNALQHPAFTF